MKISNFELYFGVMTKYVTKNDIVKVLITAKFTILLGFLELFPSIWKTNIEKKNKLKISFTHNFWSIKLLNETFEQS